MHQQIKGSLKEAMLAKNETKLSVIRGLLSAFTNELVSKGRTPQDFLSDEEVLTVINRQAKQRKDSIEQFTSGGRPELAEPEQLELEILMSYLPAQMSEDEIKTYVENKKQELGITDKAKILDLVKTVMPELKGKADGALVKKVIDQSFA